MKQNMRSNNRAPDDAASWDYAEIWDKFPVPARPAKEELTFLEQEMSSKRHDNALILGSTIEYRALCRRLGIAPYVADFERSHYEILSSYAGEDFSGEHFLEVDWLDLDDKNKYDIILGHRAINVVGKEVLQKFFQLVHRALKPRGIFYCKGNIRYEGEKEKFDEMVDKWAFKKEREYPLLSYIEVPLYFHTADADGYVVYPRARQVVAEMFENKRCTEEDYQLIKLLVSMSDDARFRGLIREREIRAIIAEVGFSKAEWIILDKDICRNMPVIKLTK